ncbi:hypothetical protein [Saccharothrix longispora]|uniref:hypothetical protein n=1 Tax=Saccharothrix longispora TaxID=33920 RepID=UPI0028FD7FF9|nr:hypothetical protein [Saccharothrix longispora]MDU0291258.1 hypothetical protein [Saccharothrix longispora]
MAVIPLAEGDLRWVFPHLADVGPVLDVLTGAATLVERLGAHLGRPAPLAFDHLPGAPYAGLSGVARTDELTFEVHLLVPRDPHDRVLRAPPPWQVTGEVSVRCDSVRDCGRHEIETLEVECATPVEAAEGVRSVAGWLLARGTAVPPGAWRERDVLSRHR